MLNKTLVGHGFPETTHLGKLLSSYASREVIDRRYVQVVRCCFQATDEDVTKCCDMKQK
jgi:hypothetical protein